MKQSDAVSRRRMLAATLAAGGLTLLAGCPDDNNDNNDDVDDEDEEADWEAVDEFVFEGRIEAWTAVEPNFLEGEDNPTITLIEGQEYDFTWINEDGQLHNLEIRDEDGDVVDDYVSDDSDEEGEEVLLEGVVATPEMTTYICQYHPTTQVGDIEVEAE